MESAKSANSCVILDPEIGTGVLGRYPCFTVIKRPLSDDNKWDVRWKIGLSDADRIDNSMNTGK